MITVLIVEDDQFLSQSLVRLMLSQDYDAGTAFDLETGWREFCEQSFDLVILDLSLPDGDGLTLCKRIRERSPVPILMLTSRSESIDKVIGFDAGADDYLTKPFDPHELVARIKALLRRSSIGNRTADSIVLGDLRIDNLARVVSYKGEKIEMTNTEFQVLEMLASRSGHAIHRDLIFEHVWGYSKEFTTNSLDVIIYRLRSKLKSAGAVDAIETVRGFGFKYAPQGMDSNAATQTQS